MEKPFYYEPQFHSAFTASCVESSIHHIMYMNGIPSPLLYFDYSLDIYMLQDNSLSIGYRFGCKRPIFMSYYLDKIWEYNISDYKQCWQEMKKRMDDHCQIVAFSDVYLLPYTPYYNKEHGIHSFILTDYNEANDQLFIIDDYKWFYNGPISLQSFHDFRKQPFTDVNARNTVLPNHSKWFFIDLHDWQTCSAFESLRQNIGKTLRVYYDPGESKYPFAGINCFQYIYDTIKSARIFYELLDELKDMFFTVYHRWNFHQYCLQQMGNIHNSNACLIAIKELGHSIAQWRSMLNLCTKIQISRDERLFDRLKERLEETIELEASRKNTLQAIYTSI